MSLDNDSTVLQLVNELEIEWVNIIKRSMTSTDMIHIDSLYDNPSKKVYPPKNKLFEAFKYFTVKDTKVVILGQDPYHKQGQAHGLAFSVNEGIKIPPSLRNIYAELKKEYPFGECDNSTQLKTGNLTNWAKQGVLLLNTALTVEEGMPDSHTKFWRSITDNIIKEINTHCNSVIFMLWGKKAQAKNKYINKDQHFIISRAHPSPFAANRGGWFNEQQFDICNKELVNKGYHPIAWV